MPKLPSGFQPAGLTSPHRRVARRANALMMSLPTDLKEEAR